MAWGNIEGGTFVTNVIFKYEESTLHVAVGVHHSCMQEYQFRVKDFEAGKRVAETLLEDAQDNGIEYGLKHVNEYE